MSGAEKRRRRRHAPVFKAEAVLACQGPGVSLSAVALERQINANLLRRWVKEAARKTTLAVAGVPGAAPHTSGFVPIAITAPKPAPAERPIRVQVRRRSLRIVIEWPASAGESCASWLKDLLR